STKPSAQAPCAAALDREGEEKIRRDVVAGGFRLREAARTSDAVVIGACGAIGPEALPAAHVLAEAAGVETTVLCVSSPDRLYRDWREGVSAPLRGRPVRE